MAAGVGYQIQYPFNTPPKPPPQQAAASNNPLVNQYKLYNTAVQQNAGDYSDIMQQYKNLLNKPATPYTPSAASTSAVANLGELSQSGGYSGADQANIRERGISPIRSLYAGAQRNIDRQRGLQGGYSPNYGALQAKLAREMSSSIGDQMTNVNATLAQNIAQNRMGAASNYASSAQNQDQMAQQQNQFNTQQPFNALSGMQSMYGTTPALSATFGNQALQGAQLQQQINQQPQARQIQQVAPRKKDQFGFTQG
jgi:hypothetical protein